MSLWGREHKALTSIWLTGSQVDEWDCPNNENNYKVSSNSSAYKIEHVLKGSLGTFPGATKKSPILDTVGCICRIWRDYGQ